MTSRNLLFFMFLFIVLVLGPTTSVNRFSLLLTFLVLGVVWFVGGVVIGGFIVWGVWVC